MSEIKETLSERLLQYPELFETLEGRKIDFSLTQQGSRGFIEVGTPSMSVLIAVFYTPNGYKTFSLGSGLNPGEERFLSLPVYNQCLGLVKEVLESLGYTLGGK
ncbi:hypothetical protein HY500_01145 [Candidatus Woesearchaeota archaeon]|nr:hypothetical protein [Candidatus Woesearchaeota archaeon]